VRRAWCSLPPLPFPFPGATTTATATTTAAPPPATTTATTPPPVPTKPPSALADARVIEYGATWCGPCKQLKSDLTSRQVPFVFVNVEDTGDMQSPAGRHAAEMPAEMRGGIPVTRVVKKDGRIDWVKGADANRIEQGYRGP
jgi:thiol-disulfide isomerase/thioredoxin